MPTLEIAQKKLDLARKAEEKCNTLVKHEFKNHVLMFDYNDEMLNTVDISIFM